VGYTRRSGRQGVWALSGALNERHPSGSATDGCRGPPAAHCDLSNRRGDGPGGREHGASVTEWRPPAAAADSAPRITSGAARAATLEATA